MHQNKIFEFWCKIIANNCTKSVRRRFGAIFIPSFCTFSQIIEKGGSTTLPRKNLCDAPQRIEAVSAADLILSGDPSRHIHFTCHIRPESLVDLMSISYVRHRKVSYIDYVILAAVPHEKQEMTPVVGEDIVIFGIIQYAVLYKRKNAVTRIDGSNRYTSFHTPIHRLHQSLRLAVKISYRHLYSLHRLVFVVFGYTRTESYRAADEFIQVCLHPRQTRQKAVNHHLLDLGRCTLSDIPVESVSLRRIRPDEQIPFLVRLAVHHKIRPDIKRSDLHGNAFDIYRQQPFERTVVCKVMYHVRHGIILAGKHSFVNILCGQ